MDTLNFINQSSGNPTAWEWDFGDGVGTSTAEDTSYKYAAPGDYLVSLTVSNDFGSNTNSKLVKVADTTATGLGTIEILSEVIAYPVPARSVVNIKPINTNMTDVIEVFNAAGKMVMKQGTDNASVIQLNTAILSNGVYFFNIYNDGELTNRGKFTVQQ